MTLALILVYVALGIVVSGVWNKVDPLGGNGAEPIIVAVWPLFLLGALLTYASRAVTRWLT